MSLTLPLKLAAAPMSYGDFRATVVQPPAPQTIAYGVHPLQHVELWKPAGKTKPPVVFMIHGGCWQSAVAKADIMHALANDLMARGIAVWNIDYRGIDVPGGGWPGTFDDVRAAADLLAREGPKLGLDTTHVVAVGHSAGGHLALWLAAQKRLKFAGVVGQGALPDLKMAKADAAEACGADTVDRLVGSASYAQTSPPEMLPLRVRQRLFAGAEDRIAPPVFSQSYATLARAKGDDATVTVIPDSGHFELIAPGTPAWAAQVKAIEALLQPRPR